MTEHIRKRIRDAVCAALRQNTIFAGVYPSQRTAFQRSELPAFCVYTVSEDSAVMNIGAQRHLQREVELIVEAVTQVPDESEDPLDDTLDALATVVETLVNADHTSGGLAYDTVLVRTVMAIQDTKNADVPTGSAALTFRVTYRTRKDDPTTTN